MSEGTARILVVEDEEKLAKFVQLELGYEGYEVMVANDGLSGLMAARDHEPDLVLLDWMMPGLTGLEVCRRLRATGAMMPVILLTAKDGIEDRVAGLDAGADDYVVKPFSIEELLARVRAHLRRNQPDDPEVFSFADLSLSRKTREVKRGDRAIELTAKEFDLLDYLISHPKQVLTRDRILEEVWGYDFMGDNKTVDVHIRWLREKLEENPSQPKYLKTVRGFGYRLG